MLNILRMHGVQCTLWMSGELVPCMGTHHSLAPAFDGMKLICCEAHTLNVLPLVFPSCSFSW